MAEIKAKYSHIIKGGYYYRPQSRGYTEHKYEAGIFLTSDAEDHKKHCAELHIVPIDIDEHNEMIREHIREVEPFLIEQEEISLRLSPFTALTILSLVDVFKGRMKDIPECARIMTAIEEYQEQVTDTISMEQIKDAQVEKDIFKAMNNINDDEDEQI